MAFINVRNIKISGIAAAVPKNIEDNVLSKVFSNKEESEKFIESTGIRFRHTVKDENICTSDLCYEAAQKLISKLNWRPEDIDCLIFVSQTPDYILPATSPILQYRLGMSIDSYAMDISLGCSGWVYGLSTVASLLSNGSMKKALLLAGDTTTVTKSDRDKSTYPLFGDAGTATAIEYSEGSEGMKFHFGTDGKSYDAIIIPDGGFRNFVSLKSFDINEIEPGIFKNKLQSVLNGPAVFTFGITKAPRSVNQLLEKYSIDFNEVDYFVFHQANLFMNEKIRTKLKIPEEKVPYSLNEYGNTSSASIPLTIVSRLNEKLSKGKHKMVACAFGVGLSWGTVSFDVDNLVCESVIEI
jgi:3-oxoacyl-[acyl-carrier-protein] synthase-3